MSPTLIVDMLTSGMLLFVGLFIGWTFGNFNGWRKGHKQGMEDQRRITK